MFIKAEKAVKIEIDPDAETADTDTSNNVFPRSGSKSAFEAYKASAS